MQLLAVLLGAPPAVAQAPCPAIGDEVADAWALFDDAELEAAKQRIGAAYQALKCQPEVVAESSLLELYRLDALVSLSLQDQKGATYATIRAVAADHVNGSPPEEYGPRLAELYALWAERLSETLIRVSVAGGGKVWIDGRPVDVATSPLQVAQGEHLIQVRDGGTLASEIHDLSEDIEIATTDPLPEGFTPPPPPVDPSSDPRPEPTSAPTRRRSVPPLIGGGLATAAGAACLSLASLGETAFHDDPFDARAYNGCPATAACYGDARRDAVRAEAARIRALYVVGYASTALGVTGLGVGLVGVPAAGGSAGVTVSGRF